MGSDLSSFLLIAANTTASEQYRLIPTEENAIICPASTGLSLGLHRPAFEKLTGNIQPRLNLRIDRKTYSVGYPEMIWALVENISELPVVIVPAVFGGRSLLGRNQRMPLVTLEPGEIHKLTRLSVDDECYRLECYASGLPHLPCNGISQKVDPTSIVLACYPTTCDVDYSIFTRNKERPETWIIYIDYEDTGEVSKIYLRYESVQISASSADKDDAE